MATIQSGMLIALGFLAATLLGLLGAPAVWRRAVRLTTRRIKDRMPISEMEIEADRDRIRAEYAIKMHKLEALVEQVKLAAARQQIEINRRDARVNVLEADLEKLRASYEEAQNARRVLEQTIADRLPKVEVRLTEAKKVLFARERELGELGRTVEQQAQALAEASALNATQKGEIERLSASAKGRGRVNEGAADRDAEIESLRAKARDQGQLIERLQARAGRPGAGDAPASAAADTANDNVHAQQAELDKQVSSLRARNDDQAAEIARLKAAIAVFERDAENDGKHSIRETKVALKAKLESLEAQAVQQTDTVVKLRSELALANERLARQAAHFTGELKRLGATGGGRRRASATDARLSLADRVAQARAGSAHSANDAVAAGSANDTLTASAVPPDAGQDQPDAAEPARETAQGASGGRPRLLDRIAGLSRTP